MTLGELLRYLDRDLSCVVLDGEPAETLIKARQGRHANALVGEIIAAIAHRCGCTDAECTLERAHVVSAVGPIRLRYMADDAPIDGFRLIEKLVLAVDGAFNEEALRGRQSG
jgi:hypothetical protein